MSKIKIGFEITDIFDNGAFRDVILALQNNPQNLDDRLEAGDIELFLISTNDSSVHIWRTGALIGLDTDHIIACATVAVKLARIESNEIQIFLDDLQSTVISIDVDSEYCDGILVDNKQAYDTVNPKWYVTMLGIIKKLLDEL